MWNRSLARNWTLQMKGTKIGTKTNINKINCKPNSDKMLMEKRNFYWLSSFEKKKSTSIPMSRIIIMCVFACATATLYFQLSIELNACCSMKISDWLWQCYFVWWTVWVCELINDVTQSLYSQNWLQTIDTETSGQIHSVERYLIKWIFLYHQIQYIMNGLHGF